MVGRFSAVTGPVIWSVVTFLTITKLGMLPRVGQGIGVLTLMALMVISYIILQPVSDEPRTWSGTDLHPAEVPGD